MTKNRLFNASLLALAISMPAAMAQAQTDDRQRSAIDVLTDEIVVTATKKADGENQQDTKLAITALGADQLEALQFRNLSDLAFKAPNVQLDEIGTVKGVASFSVRGLGVNSSIPSIDPAVGTFVDGIYLGVNAGVVFDTFDVDSVEILRGPQGVLFGRNVTGGAVVLNTGNPTDEFAFKTKFSAESGLRGTGENYTVQGVVSGPLGETGLKAKLGGFYNTDGGFHENLFDNSLLIGGPFEVTQAEIDANDLDNPNFGLSESFTLRGALEYDGIEGLNLLAKVEYGESEGDGPAGQSSVNGNGVPSFASAVGIPGQTFDPDTFDFAVNNRGFQDTDWFQVSLKGDIDVAFGNGTITNIFGYRETTQVSSSDIDASVISVFDGLAAVDQDQISNEIRYNGRFFDDRLDFTTGFFYFNQDIIYTEQRRVGPDAVPFPFTANFDGGGIQNSETFGVFASGEYDVTDRLSVNAGVRWNDETKEADIATIQPLSADFQTSCTTEGSSLSGDQFCNLVEFPNFSSSNFSPKVGVGYEFSDNFRGYAHWARAFRAGGFNLRNTAADSPTDVLADIESPGPFGDERIDSFEIGFKSEPFGGVRFNGAGFFNTIDDIQREINVAGGTAIVQQVIANAGDVEVFGVEFDALWPVTENLILNGALGITESNFTEVNINLLATNPGEIADPAGNLIAPFDGVLDLDLPRLAPLSASVGFTYFQNFGFGDLTFNGSYSHRDEVAFTDNNLGTIPAQDRFDASISYLIPDTGINATLYGKNLSNDVLVGGDTQLGAGTFSPLAKGRLFGVELTYEY